MRISRLYIDAPLAEQKIISLRGERLNYISNVLRLKINTPLTIFNGQGGEYQATISSLGKREAELTLGEFSDNNLESALPIILAQGISRGERMDFTLQKATELGVTGIIPLFSERCSVTLKADRLEKRMRHWQGIVRSACEQCGRNQIPEIEKAQHFDDFLKNGPSYHCLLLDPESKTSLASMPSIPDAVTLLIGPEGGFSEKERALAYANNFQGIQLGPRILRTETAAISAISAIQVLWGDLR